jgi:hypothetical protein
MNEAHVDCRIRIQAIDEDRQLYPVEAEIELPDQKEPLSFRDGWFDLDEKGLALDKLNLEAYGKRLYDALFDGPVDDAYMQALSYAQMKSAGRLRLRLEIDRAAPELHALRWETLHPANRRQLEPLATDAQTPFSRYTPLNIPKATPGEYPVKILYAVANPADLDQWGMADVDVETEIRNILAACADLRRTGLVELTIMPGQSEEKLPRKLIHTIKSSLGEEGLISGPTSLDNLKSVLGQFDIFHFLGHGRFKKARRRRDALPANDDSGRPAGDAGAEVSQAALFLESDDEDDAGFVDLVDDETFTEAMAAYDSSLKLLFLASCETARVDEEQRQGSPLVGLAPRLVNSGIPAVIAMQDVIEMEAAREITASFYSNLFLHGQVDRALNQARYQIHDHEEAGWSVPVLFLRQATLFKAEPVRLVMEKIHHAGRQRFRPLPIEVAHLVGTQEAGNIQRYSDGSTATLGILDAVDIIFAASEPVAGANATRQKAKFALLVGRPGGAKTTQLKNIARYTVRNSLLPDAHHKVVPLVIELEDYHAAAAGPGSNIEQMVYQELRRYWPDLTFEELLRRLEGRSGTSVFRLLFDGGGDMSKQHRHAVWEGIGEFVKEYPRQQYVLTLDRRYYDSERLNMATDVLIMQPLSRRRVEEYLLTSRQPANERLCRELTDKHLFDLAASPWILIKMIEQAGNNVFPKSRAEVLEGTFQQMLASHFPKNDSRREWAEQSLYRLAYQMYQQRERTYDEEKVFAVMADVRQYRDYSLDSLFASLIDCGVLARTIPANVRFARRGLQAYCCAKAIAQMDIQERYHVIDDITASLGRLTRLRWWEPVLILLSGLVDNPDDLLRAIDFGIDMTEGQQLFVMARCLLEIDSKRVDDTIRDNVINALIWRLHGETERRVDRRARAAAFLGELNATVAADNLARIALGIDLPEEANEGGSADLLPGTLQSEPNDIPGAGDSLVSLESAMALAEIMSTQFTELKEIADHYTERGYEVVAELFHILEMWMQKDVSGLAERLRRPDDHPGIRAISGYALGNIATTEANDLLITAFLQAGKPDETVDTADMRWALTEALTLLDSAQVARRIILPLLDEAHARDQGLIDAGIWQRRVEFYPYLVYLIGRIRSQEPIILDFLHNCINRPTDLPIMLGAIKALGTLYAVDNQKDFINLAKGEFPEWLKLANAQEEIWLRRVAIEALGHIGDQGCIRQLQRKREHWPPELERALYLASQEIDWRLDYQPKR